MPAGLRADIDVDHCRLGKTNVQACRATGGAQHCRIQSVIFQVAHIETPAVPANALLAEDGTPILTEDGQFIIVEP